MGNGEQSPGDGSAQGTGNREWEMPKRVMRGERSHQRGEQMPMGVMRGSTVTQKQEQSMPKGVMRGSTLTQKQEQSPKIKSINNKRRYQSGGKTNAVTKEQRDA